MNFPHLEYNSDPTISPKGSNSLCVMFRHIPTHEIMGKGDIINSRCCNVPPVDYRSPVGQENRENEVRDKVSQPTKFQTFHTNKVFL